MLKTRTILLMAIVSIGFILLVLEYKKGYQPPKWEPIEPQYRSSRSFSEFLGELLHDYYSGDEKSTATSKQHFIEYVLDDGIFATYPPPKGYESKGDLSFYIIWPENLKSTNPQLVAYTQPFNKMDEKDLRIKYRCLLFFRGNEPVTIISKNAWAKVLIGSDNLKKEPDLYLWPKYDNYKRDEKAKKTKTTNDTNS